jgi:hypothetical protein
MRFEFYLAVVVVVACMVIALMLLLGEPLG